MPIKSKFAERGQCAAAFLSLLGFGGDFQGGGEGGFGEVIENL